MKDGWQGQNKRKTKFEMADKLEAKLKDLPAHVGDAQEKVKWRGEIVAPEISPELGGIASKQH